MNILEINNKSFFSLWSEFVINNNSSWSYLLKRLDFYNFYTSNIRDKNLSFIIVNNNKPVCLCLVFLEKYNNKNYFTYAKSFIKAPVFCKSLNNNSRKKVEKLCFKHIDKLAVKYKVVKLMFSLDPIISNHNFLLNHDFFDASLNTSIIYLNESTENIWSKIRKSYHSLINNGTKYFSIFEMDYTNCDRTIFDIHKQMHLKVSKRKTRSDNTWNVQYDMIKDDNAMLLGLKYKNKFVGFSYFVHANNSSYYGNSSNDPEFLSEFPLEPTIIWTAIKYYKKRSFNYFELGIQHFKNNIFYNFSKKDINISFFKRGFGGEMIPVYRGIKYYDDKFLINDLKNKISDIS